MNCIPQLSALQICGFDADMREMLDRNSPVIAAIARDCIGNVVEMDILVWSTLESELMYKLTVLGNDGIGSFDFRSVHGILSEMEKLPDFYNITVVDFEWTRTEPGQMPIGILTIEMPSRAHFQLSDFTPPTD